MGMLDRYRKTGGFVQLVSLIEALLPSKQEKFLNMILEEDPIWYEAVKMKMLTVEKIFSWSDNTVSEIVRRLPTKSLASALKGLKPEHNAKAFCLMSNSEKRKVEDEMSGLSDNPAEAMANVQKLIETTRKMIQETDLRLDGFAPDLVIEEGIEAKLSNKGAPAATQPTSGGQPIKKTPVTKEPPAVMPSTVPQLQKVVADLNLENNKLKAQIKILKEELERRIKAA